MTSRQHLTTENADYMLDVCRRERLLRQVERDRLARSVSDPPVRYFQFPSLTELLASFGQHVRQMLVEFQHDLMAREHRLLERRHHRV